MKVSTTHRCKLCSTVLLSDFNSRDWGTQEIFCPICLHGARHLASVHEMIEEYPQGFRTLQVADALSSLMWFIALSYIVKTVGHSRSHRWICKETARLATNGRALQRMKQAYEQGEMS